MNKTKVEKQRFKIGDRFENFVVLEEDFDNKVKCFCIDSKEILIIEIEQLQNKSKRSSRQKVRIAEMYEQCGILTCTDNNIKRGKYGQKLIQVRCSCGTQKYVKNFDFVNRRIASCGCLKKVKVREARTTHGLYKSKEYKVWLRLKTICLNENDPSFEKYGQIGINMCPEWSESFQKFYSDMGPCPDDSIITRIDPSKGFSSANCCWLSRNEAKKIQILIECGAKPETLFKSNQQLNKNTEAKLSKNKIAAIRSLHAKGESNLSNIAKQFGVTEAQIVDILIYK